MNASTESTVSSVIADEVLRRGATTFGLMGNGNAYFLDALVRGGGSFVTVRHEVAAVAAADTAWRVGRRIAVASVTYGAGLTNSLTALAEAAMHRTPLVLVAGDQPTTGARPWDVDQAALVDTVGARVVTVGHRTAPADAAGAFELALAERVPVVLLLPYDLTTVGVPALSQSVPHASVIPRDDGLALSPLGATPPGALPSGRAAEQPSVNDYPTIDSPDAAALATAISLLESANRPLIVAGDGARNVGGALGALADKLDALTATTAIAKGTFAGRTSDLGVCGGFAAPDSAALIAEADVVLVIGAALNQFTMAFGHAFGSEATVIQVDRSDVATHPRVDVFVRGDARVIVDTLTAAIPHASHEDWRVRAQSARSHNVGEGIAADGRLDPRGLFVRLNQLLPANRIVVQDGGHFSGWAPMFWDVSGPARFHMVGTAFQTIGLGVAAALGASVTSPHDLTVLVAGDGGFLMSLADLESVARTAAHCLIVVVNDGSYGAEVHQYGARGVHRGPMEIGGVDFAALARGAGAAATTVTSLDDLSVLDDWLSSGAPGTLLLDCLVSPVIVAPYMEHIVQVTEAAEASHRERFASA